MAASFHVPAIRTRYGQALATDVVRWDVEVDLRAHAAGRIAWHAAYAAHVSPLADLEDSQAQVAYASDLADYARDMAEAKVYARAAREA